MTLLIRLNYTETIKIQSLQYQDQSIHLIRQSLIPQNAHLSKPQHHTHTVLPNHQLLIVKQIRSLYLSLNPHLHQLQSRPHYHYHLSRPLRHLPLLIILIYLIIQLKVTIHPDIMYPPKLIKEFSLSFIIIPLMHPPNTPFAHVDVCVTECSLS